MKQFLNGLIQYRRQPWEAIASLLIALGVIMLMQPFYMLLFTYSFAVTLAGTLLYLVCSHFRD